MWASNAVHEVLAVALPLIELQGCVSSPESGILAHRMQSGMSLVLLPLPYVARPYKV